MHKKNLFYLSIILCLLLLTAGCGGSEQTGNPAEPSGDVKTSVSSNLVDNTNLDVDGSKETEVEKTDKKDAGNEEKTENNLKTNEKPVPASKATRKTDQSRDRISLLITRDFGAKALVQEKPTVNKNENILDVLETLAEVKTGYDGGLVIGINGLETNTGGLSGKRQDWFYFINGICADIGARDYVLQAGESIWWDYHVWESVGPINSAVIGCYPEPFIHGYRGKTEPTTIMSHADDITLADELQKSLKAQGAASVSVKELDENLLKKRQGPVIVVGEWDKLKDMPWLGKLNKAYRKNGTSVHFTDGNLELLDYRGQVGQIVTKNAGVIAASGGGLGDGSPLWLVTGTDREGLQQAVNILVNSPERIRCLYSAAVISGKLVRLPLS
ncbi:MAG: DUF4430 domain-containing protein [Syntrophothermaceae bacterium]|jgi:hypothetical protein